MIGTDIPSSFSKMRHVGIEAEWAQTLASGRPLPLPLRLNLDRSAKWPARSGTPFFSQPRWQQVNEASNSA